MLSPAVRVLALIAALCVISACQSGAPAAADWDRAAGTPWRLERIGGAAVLAGSAVTLRFEADGRVVGNAGANNYFAAYQRDGDRLSLGPAGATRMFLDDPPGLMDQESRFLALLQSVEGFRLAGERLELLAGGETVLRFAPDAP